jgi:hypothetical protein
MVTANAKDGCILHEAQIRADPHLMQMEDPGPDKLDGLAGLQVCKIAKMFSACLLTGRRR